MPSSDDVANAIAADVIKLIKHVESKSVVRDLPSYLYSKEDPKTGVTSVFINYMEYSDFLAVLFRVVIFNDTIYIYDETKSIFRKQSNEIECHIRDTCKTYGVVGKLKPHEIEIMTHIHAIRSETDYPFNVSEKLIPVKNGVLKLDTDKFPYGYNYATLSTISSPDGIIKIPSFDHRTCFELIPSGPENKFTYRIPVTYNPSASDGFHENVMSKYLGADNVAVLYQIPAQALMQSMGWSTFKKSYILQGDANGGKSTYLNAISKMFGEDLLSHISLHQVAGLDNFVKASLENKLLNTFDDLTDVPLKDVGQFKAITGKYDFTIEPKYKNPYNGLIRAVHVFACNSPPDIPENVSFDPAFWVRWEYLHFDSVFDMDPTFEKRNFTEANMSGFLNRVLTVMLDMAYKNSLVVNSQPSHIKSEWAIASDPLKQFIGDCFISVPKEIKFDKEQLLRAFQKYCKDRSNIPERKIPTSQTAFTQLCFKNGIQEKHNAKGQHFYTALYNWKTGCTYNPEYKSHTLV